MTLKNHGYIVRALILSLLCPIVSISAQIAASQDQAAEQAALEKKALDLLDRTIGDGRALRLP